MTESRRVRFASLLLIATLGTLASAASVGRSQDDAVRTAAAKIRHVFLIVLENKNYEDTFETSSQDPYLQKTLVPMGGLLTEYYGTGHVSLDNYISMISGMAPTPSTDNDCLPGFSGGLGNYDDVQQTGTTPDGQVIASGGCIYAKDIKTLPQQLEEVGLSWKGYMGDMGNDPSRESATCGHPVIGLGTDRTNTAEAPSSAVPLGDAYATRHNPFMYFHSIIDSPNCQTRVVNLNELGTDLASARTTPNFVFITPNLCDDGHDGAGTGDPGTTCANGQPGGLTSIDAFLQRWVPRIMASPAYHQDGLLIITFDESSYVQNVSTDPNTGQKTVSITFPGRTCCDEQPGPNVGAIRPGTFTLLNTPSLVRNIVVNGYGGDRVGALLLSPFIAPGSRSSVPYNHYSLLRSLEAIFRVRGHLGYAADNPGAHYFLNNIANDPNVFQTRHPGH